MPTTYDVAIIGGGVVGCAVLYTLSKAGYTCVLMEKCSELASGASGGNSGMWHTGFDSTEGTKENILILKSRRLIKEFIEKNNIPLRDIGAIMAASDNTQMEKVRQYVQNAHKQGVTGARLLSREDIISLEPNLKSDVVGGLYIPGEAVVDSNLLCVALAHQGLRHGNSRIMCNCEVNGGSRSDAGDWVLDTTNGDINAKCAINAAGLFGDKVESIKGASKFNITPRKGQFLVYGKDAGNTIKHIILPVPQKAYKGVLVWPSVYGQLVVGPTKEITEERSQPSTDDSVLGDLKQHAERIVPSLKSFKPIGSYAGIRPATEEQDYHIYADEKKQWVTVGGIRSTGVSACLGIADEVMNLVKDKVRISPSSHILSNKSQAPVMFTDKPSYVLDGVEYKVVHGLMKYGLTSKL